MAPDPLALVEELKKKSYEFSSLSDDIFVPVISKSHEAVSLILKDADRRRIQTALAILQLERSSALSLESVKEPSIRSMMYETIESFHLAIVHLMDKLTKDNWTQPEEIPSVDTIGNDIVFKDDEIVEEEQGPLEVATDNAYHPDSAQPDNMSTAPTFCHSFPIYKRELIDPSENQTIPADTQIALKDSVEDKLHQNQSVPVVTQRFTPKDSVEDKVIIKKEEITKEEILDDYMGPLMNLMGDDAPLREEVKEENSIPEERALPLDNGLFNELDDNFMDGTNQSEIFDDDNGDSREIEMIEKEGKKKKKTARSADDESSSESEKSEKGGRSSRRVSKPLKYAESEDDKDEHEEPSKTMSKSKAKKNNGRKRKPADVGSSDPVSPKKKPRGAKRSETAMECIECDYSTTSVSAWAMHLRMKHSTTPALSGLVLRCECGHECLSERHSFKCAISNFTVVRKRDEPIRRLDDEKGTPQCVLCEIYPKTVIGYANHLCVSQDYAEREGTSPEM